MVASHSSCWSLREHFRAKTGAVIRSIVETGGYVGICYIPSFLGGNGNITALLDHLDCRVKNFSADRVAIGTDAGYQIRDYDDQSTKVQSQKFRTAFSSLWPKNILHQSNSKIGKRRV